MAFLPTYLISSHAKIPAMCNICKQNSAAKNGGKISAYLVPHLCAASIVWHAPRGHAGTDPRRGTAYRTGTAEESTLCFQSTEETAELLLH